MNELTKVTPTFCILPFVHAATLTDGSTPVCCVADKWSDINLNEQVLADYWNSDYLRDVRSRMLAGKPVAACTRCYEEEKNGYKSHRIFENNAWTKKLGQEEFLRIVKEAEAGRSGGNLLSVDLRLGNTCNLQCVMCQPRDSSKWNGAKVKFLAEITEPALRDEWKYKSQIKSEMFEWYRNGNFWENLKTYLPNLRELIVGGGEPMLIKEHLEFIKHCAESGEASHIHLRYHTNLMVFPEEMIPYWEKFEHVEFFVSVDGIGKIANYVRYPSQWEVVKKNLETIDLLGENIWMRTLFSVHSLNIHHLPEYLLWIKNRNFKKMKTFPGIQNFVHPGIVHWPQYMNVKTLPPDYKEFVTEQWARVREEFADQPFDEFEGIIQLMNSEDWSNKIPLLRNYVQALDRTRGTDFYNTFPELSESLLALN